MSLSDDLQNPSSEDLQEQSAKEVARTLRRRVSALEQQSADFEALANRFAAMAPSLPKGKVPKFSTKETSNPYEMVAILSDAHATEAWTKNLTDGQTEYNFDIFCKYLWYYATEIVRIAGEHRRLHGVKVLHIDILGDILHGMLRLDDECTNDFPRVPGITNTAYVLFQWIVGLLQHFEQINIVAMAGNHGRLHQKPQSKRYVVENLDTMLYLFTRAMLLAGGFGERVQFDIPRSRVYTFLRMGHRIKVGHGDHIKGGNSIAGLPIYGLSREMLRQFRKELKSDKEQKGIDLIEYGHFHQFSILENTLVVNGSMCPTGPWAFDELGMLADPTQVVYFTSAKFTHGGPLPLSLKYGDDIVHQFSYDKNSDLTDEPMIAKMSSWNVPVY